MSAARPSTRTPATEVRAALVAAGRRLLERDGPSGVTVRAVAAEAGVAPMGVYNHFDGKAGLLDALVTDGFTEFMRMIGATDADAVARLTTSGRRYREFALANPRLYALMFSPEQCADDDVAAASFETLAEIVRYGQAAGTIRPGDPELLAAEIWACVHGAVALELAGSQPPWVNADLVYAGLIDLLSRGLAP